MQEPERRKAGPVGALAYWMADAIKNRYVKNPAPLVPA
jgi:gluconate 2-dehydrogenase alpha chain